ncbi:LysE family translocator [Polaromonas eurypsychrophila]|uniref:Threonine efflux protein n=1 Tax=Polaromonas eurypsychrophila TaxID=1614635 RepID=A0A916WL02_9BURK|nr:LysE family transporter [Polaromonas eurypsychrophila]GGB07671.1 threonine efflux protein [Polaromonas eurypsychrophila]
MLSSLIAIALLHWAVLLVPGFNVVLLAQLAGGQSRATAFAAVGGMTSATLAWATLAVMGVGVVFSSQPQLRQGAQIAGGLYLLYLAYKLWRSGTSAASVPPGTLSYGAAFRVGFMTSALNPKIALFYGSVFATALPPSPSWLHVACAVVVVYLNSIIWHTSLAIAFSQKAVQQVYLRNFARLSKVSGAVVGAFGLRLIVGTLQELRARMP